MTKYVVVGVLIVGVALVSYMGCDGAKARLGVAGDKALKKIDDMIGELDIRQKEVQNAFEEVKEMTDNTRAKRIEAEVLLEQKQEKQNALKTREDELKASLREVRTLLSKAKESGSIERDGEPISIEKLTAFAESGVKKLKTVQTELANLKTISGVLANNLKALKKQEDQSVAQLERLSNQLMEINAKKDTLDVMKDSPALVGTDESINDKFKELSESVDELMVDIDTAWKLEEIKLDERVAEMDDESFDIDELLGDKSNVDSTLSDIDALLGDSDSSTDDDSSDDDGE